MIVIIWKKKWYAVIWIWLTCPHKKACRNKTVNLQRTIDKNTIYINKLLFSCEIVPYFINDISTFKDFLFIKCLKKTKLSSKESWSELVGCKDFVWNDHSFALNKTRP